MWDSRMRAAHRLSFDSDLRCRRRCSQRGLKARAGRRSTSLSPHHRYGCGEAWFPHRRHHGRALEIELADVERRLCLIERRLRVVEGLLRVLDLLRGDRDDRQALAAVEIALGLV